MQYQFVSEARTKAVQHLLIHSFALSPKKMLDTLQHYKLSVHYMIDSTGKIYSLVPEERVAWHAGPSFWAGKSGLNQTSVGIELEHLGYGQTEYPKVQINALIKLAKEIIARHKIRSENIVGHSDIAPTAKADPGRGFPWHTLAKNGIGLWYDLKKAEKMKETSAAELLSLIGYEVKGKTLKASAWAFRQRFMPESVPVDKGISQREKLVFKSRQQAARLPLSEREEFLSKAPAIYPPNNDISLTDPHFIKVLQAVAYQYQEAQKS